MTNWTRFAVAMIILGICMTSSAQLVSFEAPHPWMSARSDSMVLKAYFDTTRVMGKTLKVSFTKVRNGRKTRLSTKRLKISANAHTFAFTGVSGKLFGGANYISMTYAIPGTEEKGEIGPFGIADMGDYFSLPRLSARRIENNDAIEAIQSDTGAHGTAIAGGTLRLFYTSNDLLIAGKGLKASVTPLFAIDGKNSKRAFLAYADRFLRCNISEKSISGFHFTRSFSAQEGIRYNEKRWRLKGNVLYSEGNLWVISVPWHDIGFIPVNRTMAGFAVFMEKDNGAVAETWPEKAVKNMPVTWGNMILEDEVDPAKADSLISKPPSDPVK